mgnify:CR=1 FL=1
MEGFAYADIIFFAILAAYILNRLRTVLGQDDGTRLPTRNPFIASSDAKSTNDEESESNVVSIVKKSENKTAEIKQPEVSYIEPEINDKAILENIEKIKQKSPGFTAGYFVHGAKAAFDMVMEAFASGDKQTLKSLLSKQLYKDFEEEIDKREKSEAIQMTTLVAVSGCEITSANVNDNNAEISVAYKSEQISVVKDKEGKIVEGNPSAIDVVEDTWTFRKDLTSSNPNWTIVSLN